MNGNRITSRETIPQGRAYAFLPNAAGDKSQWGRSGCTINFDCVDETSSDGDASYVHESLVGNSDLYNVRDRVEEGGTISQVKVLLSARKTALQGGVSISALLKTGGVEYADPATSLFLQFTTVSASWSTNPATGQPWTWSDVNALQAGVKLASISDPELSWARVTTVGVQVLVSQIVTTFAYGKDDQLLTAAVAGGPTTTYAYDKNGNLKARVSGSGTTTYAYDAEDRLTSVTSPSGTDSYAYSADGRRMKRASGSTTTYFGNDPMGPSGYDDTIEEYGPTGAKTTTYLHGIGVDEPLGFNASSWSSYHRDALGSVTRLTDSSGATASTYRYDAFGAIRTQTGAGNTYGFASRENEAGAGLYYNRARYYDPAGGRFLSADPTGLGGGMNRYGYAGGDPVNRIDPSGMRIIWDPGGGGSGSGYGGGGAIGGGGATVSSSGTPSALGRCLVLWGMMAFVIVGTVIGIQVGRWAIATKLTNLEAVFGMTYARVLYEYIPGFAVAVAAWDFGLMMSVLVGLLFAVALVFMATLGFFDLVGFLGSWAAKTAAWPVLLTQIGIGIASATWLMLGPGGLQASGCI